MGIINRIVTIGTDNVVLFESGVRIAELIIVNVSAGGQEITLSRAKQAVANEGIPLLFKGTGYSKPDYIVIDDGLNAVSSAAGGQISIFAVVV